MNYRQSLIGFHNPYQHKGLKPKEFLDLYIDFLKSGAKKRDGKQRLKLAEWIERHYDMQLSFVYRLFPNTLERDEISN